LRVILPDDPGAELIEFLAEWTQGHAYAPPRRNGGLGNA
jgi:hypothetical protein